MNKKFKGKLGKNDIIYSCPFCKKTHILNLDKTVEKTLKEVGEVIDEEIEDNIDKYDVLILEKLKKRLKKEIEND